MKIIASNPPDKPCVTDEICDAIGTKQCSNCGQEFQCGAARRDATGGASFSCWCEELPRVPSVAAADQDCLCRECLSAALGKLTEQQSDHKSP